MLKSIIKKQLFSQVPILFSLFTLMALPCNAAVIFEDNFDNQADWIAVDGNECAPGKCSPTPVGWDSYRSVKNDGSLSNTIRIDQLPGAVADHTGTGTGKALVIYNESVNGANWPGDGVLGKYFGSSTNYQELYFQFWIRTQSNWKTVPGAALKIFRVMNWNAAAQPNFWDMFSVAESKFILELGQMGSGLNAAYVPVYRCDAGDNYCSSQNNNYEKNDIFTSFGAAPTQTYADAQWHRYNFQLKMNSPGGYDGIMRFYIDGKLIEEKTNVFFKHAQSPQNWGWNTILFGGNGDNYYTALGEQWYAIDDVVVSTTAIPADYVIGGGVASDTTPPTTSLSYPANNSTVSGTVSVTANASDSVGLSKVEYYVNGALKATDTSAPYVYSWDTSAVAAGTYSLMTKAYDAAGNVGQSGTVSVSVVKDTAVPTVSLTAPANNATVSGTVAITASAADNVGVSKVEYYKNNVLLAAGNVAPYSSNWNTTSESNGTHTITAKAYDATGNIGQSSAVSVTVNNTAADTTAPTVSVFTLPSTATSLTVAISSFTASDNVGVTGYLVTESASAPSASATGWTSSAPATFTFSAAGSKTAYAWAKDVAGNVSAAKSRTVAITLLDTAAPTVSVFTLPSTATSLTVAISSFTASDNVGVTGYLVTESASAPSASATGWTTSAPATFTFSAAGSKTAYAWAKDVAGNVSAAKSSSVSITLPVATTTLTISDALTALQIAVGKVQYTSDQMTRLDTAPYINGKSQPDGKIDIGDVIVILGKVTGKIAF